MKLRYISSKKEIQKFVNFSQEIYRNNPYYRDSLSAITLMFLTKKTAYFKHAEIYPFFIEKGQELRARAAFIIDYKQKDILMISFFEALPDAREEIKLMLEEGRKLALRKGLVRVVISLNGHLNYGVGFLASHFNVPPSFGLPYNPEYYLEYFEDLIPHSFTSFLIDIKKFNLDREQSILERVKKKGFTFRYANFNILEKEIASYTYLNNLCFKDHLWWAERSFSEDRELLYPFRWFIEEKNLIFVEKGQEIIGFLLWYPDYNQLIPPGKGIGLSTLIKNRFGIGEIDRFRIAELAIHPRYQGTGVVLGLLEMLYGIVKDRYKYCEAGWIEENNLPSKGLGLRFEDISYPYKKYKAFEVQV